MFFLRCPDVGKLKSFRKVKKLIRALNYVGLHKAHKEGKGSLFPHAIQEAAAEALGQIGDASAVEPLISALHYHCECSYCYDGRKGASVRAAAANSLGMIRDDRAVEPLIKALKNDSDASVRGFAAKALGLIGDARAVGPLITAVRDNNIVVVGFKQECGQVGVFAVEALGNIGDNRAIQPLISLLTSNSNDLIAAAAWSLGKIGHKNAVEPLIHLLFFSYNSNIAVSENALWALSQIGDASAVEPLISALSEGRVHSEFSMSCLRSLLTFGSHSTKQMLILVQNGGDKGLMVLNWLEYFFGKERASGYSHGGYDNAKIRTSVEELMRELANLNSRDSNLQTRINKLLDTYHYK